MSNLIELSQLKRAAKIEYSRRSFWRYCQTIAPDFYKDDRPHLIKLCQTLDNLYRGKLMLNGRPTKKLMINIPPQHGKSRTLINFATWVFGLNPSEKIITASYNDLTASDFSRYTRDAIVATKNEPKDIVYSDIFPKTRIKQGNAGHERWALEGQHFSYIGAGIGGSITSKGGTILIVDDPIKDAESALNENTLDKIWLWYTSTFLSRVSAEKGEPIEIINHTRWSKNDLCGKLLSDDLTVKEWYILKMEAFNEATGEMLCPSFLSKNRYDSLKRLMVDLIFRANYHQEPMDKKGVLFPKDSLKYFRKHELPENIDGGISWADIADEGEDYFSQPFSFIAEDKIFIHDVIFTKDDTGITSDRSAEAIKKHNPEWVWMESNNQGSVFYKWVRTKISDPDIIMPSVSTSNKISRIILASGLIKKYFYFLHESEYEQGSEYDLFMKNIWSFMRDGSSKHDDAPDSIAGLAKKIQTVLPEMFGQFEEPEEETLKLLLEE